MSSVKPFDEYEKEELERSQGKRQADKDLTNQQFDTNEQTIKENYGGQIEDAEESYEHLFRENRVQKLINERQIAENMANLGLTDSGLNRTQITANQLSYANNNAEYSRQRQKAVEKLNTTMNQWLTQNDIDRNAAINKIDKDYDDKAYTDAVSRRATDVEAETDRIEAQISASTAAEKEKNSALKDLYPKLTDETLTDAQKIAYIKAFVLSYGVYEGENYDEVEILEKLAGLPKGSVFGYTADDYSLPGGADSVLLSDEAQKQNTNPMQQAINRMKNPIPLRQQVEENVNSFISQNPGLVSEQKSSRKNPLLEEIGKKYPNPVVKR